jgi:hypothetical protein
MSREKLKGPSAEFGITLSTLPEADCCGGVKASIGHEEKPYLIRLKLLSSRFWVNDEASNALFDQRTA